MIEVRREIFQALPEICGETTAWPVFTVAILVVFAVIYLRGGIRLRKLGESEAGVWRASAFLGGELLVAAVIAPPLARLDQQWLTAHMVQHLVLMTLAAPLILLGEPVLMLLNGLPERLQIAALSPVQRSAPFQRIWLMLTNPVFSWLAGTLCVLVWHIPAAFALGMQSNVWHGFEQASFLAAGLLFWRPVVQPWPRIAKRERWSVPMYLFLATLPCDALSAFLTFCGRVVYAAYGSRPQLVNTSALADQEHAGVLMWVWVTFVYLIPAVVITMLMLAPADRPRRRRSCTEAAGEGFVYRR